MTLGGLEAMHDRIGKIANQIAAIENNNPLSKQGVHRATTTAAPKAAAAFQSHLASQTIGTLGLGSSQQSQTTPGLAGAQNGLLGSALGKAALGRTGLAGLSGLAGSANQSLLALLQAGALAQQGAQRANGASATSSLNLPAQPQPGQLLPGQSLPIQHNGNLPAQGLTKPGLALQARNGGASSLEQAIAALPKGTHPSIPDKRSAKVPQELKNFGNGRIPADQLESVGVKDHQLWSPAAKAFKLMRAAAQRDGINIGVNSSYRDTACQQCMVDKYGLYSQGGRAAPPGKSNHGWGLSIDLQLNDAAKKWMRANAKHYGFVEDVAREPWHWTFLADGDSVVANTTRLTQPA